MTSITLKMYKASKMYYDLNFRLPALEVIDKKINVLR